MANLFLIKRNIKKRFTPALRLKSTLVFAVLIVGGFILCLSSLRPNFSLLLGDRLIIAIPHDFELGDLYHFTEDTAVSVSGQTDKELVLQRPDSREIVFTYPQVVTLGRPAYLSSDITRSVDFSLEKHGAYGLIQIWQLSTSLQDFLDTSKASSRIEYLTFSSKEMKNRGLSYTQWEYTFPNQDGNTIHALEAFFDDTPYMYRISLYVDSEGFNEEVRAIFDNMALSVRAGNTGSLKQAQPAQD